METNSLSKLSKKSLLITTLMRLFVSFLIKSGSWDFDQLVLFGSMQSLMARVSQENTVQSLRLAGKDQLSSSSRSTDHVKSSLMEANIPSGSKRMLMWETVS